MDASEVRRRLRDRALELGFDRVAFVAAGPARDAARLDTWLADGLHADLHWMARAPEVRADPRRLLPGARSVVSLLTFYHTTPAPPDDRWVGRVSRYAWGRDYHRVLERRLRKLVRFAGELAPGARTLPGVDYRPILEKEWAERAGIGWIGKHTNLITQDAGSWFFLSELVTELDVAEPEVEPKERCGRCTACLEACPTGAIVAPFRVDARRCISWLTIENRGPIPAELRPLVGEWIFGCDICQDVCPWNRFAKPVDDPAFALDRRRFDSDLTDFLTLDRAAFEARFEGSPVRRAGRDGFLRNVCVALGNRRRPTDLGPLLGALADASPLVRAHAAWAIGRLGGDDAIDALEARRAVETDPAVALEIERAIDAA
ncbi:MAG: tRNA epoxyqueuosine(34) reductase QueG [bacterium]